ncbi:MAG: molybdopterin-synthase adenylyltransferase MoeB [Pseudomonadota bacterium]|jgi:adenylyltransferase/sulfurtransferase
MNDSQLLRYSRQILLPQVDIEGQQRLLDSRALIVGLGGLGSPVALYLAAAGVGHLMINDDDQVDLSNLQRQIIHATPDISLRKTDSAARSLSALNPDSAVTALPHRLDETELYDIVGLVDVVLDCSDNFTTRFMLNRVCVRQAKPLVSAAVIRFDGQLTVFDPRRPDSPCYNCLYPDQAERAESCARNGVMAPLPGILGSMQAMESIKLLLGIGTSPVGRLLLFDALHCEWRELRFRKDPACPTCAVF